MRLDKQHGATSFGASLKLAKTTSGWRAGAAPPARRVVLESYRLDSRRYAAVPSEPFVKLGAALLTHQAVRADADAASSSWS